VNSDDSQVAVAPLLAVARREDTWQTTTNRLDLSFNNRLMRWQYLCLKGQYLLACLSTMGGIRHKSLQLN
jgi:hypothetical protein